MDTKHIVCYAGGTCGDLITAMIDPRAVQIINTTIQHDPQRIQLKKPHLFTSVQEKDHYLQTVFQTYNSIPSHDLDYHVEKNHKFISIRVDDFPTAQWAALRFKNLHRPHVWEEMNRVCGAKTVDDYAEIMLHYSNKVSTHTDRLISLRNIVTGQAIDQLETLTGISVNNQAREIYKQWLECNETM